MKPQLLVATLLLAFAPSAVTAADRPAPEGGPPPLSDVIPQIATGGGAFFMEFQFVNASASPASVTLSFFDGDALPMEVTYVQDGVTTTATTLVETISPKGVGFAHTVLETDNAQVGYAQISGSPRGRVNVQATFNQVVEGRPLFQAFIPRAVAEANSFFVPAVSTGGRTASLAVVSATDQDVVYIGRNPNGVELCRAGRPFIAGEHRAFIVRDMLPCMAGVRGIVEVSGSNLQGVIYGVGITAQDDGAFVTQPPATPPPPLF